MQQPQKRKEKTIRHLEIKSGGQNAKRKNTGANNPPAPVHPLMKIVEWIKKYFEVNYNEITLESELTEKETGQRMIMSDAWIDTIWMRMKLDNLQINDKDLRKVLNNRDFFPSYNPFIEYFTNLKWDGKDHIAELINTITIADLRSADGTISFKDLWPDYLKKWLVSVIARAMQDDASKDTAGADQALILSGEGGKGKSRWTNKLIPDTLHHYLHSGWITVSSTDEETCNLLAEKMIINLEDQLQEIYNEFGKLKNIMTAPAVSNRKRFHRYTPKRKRRASFLGSVDDPMFLASRKNRRFTIIPVEKINYQHSVDMDQVWAQAFDMHKNGYQYWLTPTESDQLTRVNSIFRMPSIEEELIQEYFRPATDQDDITIIEYLTPTQMQQYFIKETGNNKINQYRIGKALSGELNFQRTSKHDSVKGFSVYAYDVVNIKTHPGK